MRTLAILLLASATLTASGPLGIYGIVEKVVFEPSEKLPERIQVWGAFAYVDGGGAGKSLTVSSVKRGYLYFKLPQLNAGFPRQSGVEAVLKEWTDLKAVAGTGQAVAFGSWTYIGAFTGLQPHTPSGAIFEDVPTGGARTDLRVRPNTESPSSPAAYQTNAGVVKLSDRGSHADLVKQLKASIR